MPFTASLVALATVAAPRFGTWPQPVSMVPAILRILVALPLAPRCGAATVGNVEGICGGVTPTPVGTAVQRVSALSLRTCECQSKRRARPTLYARRAYSTANVKDGNLSPSVHTSLDPIARLGWQRGVLGHVSLNCAG